MYKRSSQYMLASWIQIFMVFPQESHAKDTLTGFPLTANKLMPK